MTPGLLAVFLALAVVSPAREAERFPRGEIAPRVTCAADASHSYALYLPSAYSADRRWPLLYLLACFRATAGDRKGALDSLKSAVKNGYREVEVMEGDPDLASLRGEKEYRTILEELKRPKS